MGIKIGWDNITLNYFKSKDIKIFPCIDRGEYDKEARLNTERNFTKLGSGGFGSRISYIKNWGTSDDNSTNGILRCNICGYDIEIDTTEYNEENNNLLEIGKDSYLVLKLERTTIVSGTYTYKIGNQNKNNNTGSLDYEGSDNNYYFTGLSYFKTDQDSDISKLETTIEEDPNAEYLYYLLLIGKDNKKATESFLPVIDTSKDGGIKVKGLEIIDRDNTITWLSNYLMANPGLYLDKRGNGERDNIVIGLNLDNETTTELNSGFNMLSSTTESLNLPLKLFKVKDVNGNAFSKLGVQIPKNRAIYVKDYKDELKQLPESSVLLFDHQGGIQLDIKKDSKGRDTLSIGSRYTNPLYKDGLAIANNIEPNGLRAGYIYVPHASHISEGVVKVASTGDAIKTKDLTTSDNIDSRNYGIKTNTDNVLYVTVPWKNYDSDIANLQAEITDIKKSLAGPDVPYTEQPYAELFLNNAVVASSKDGSYTINQPLSNYKLRIYHNSQDGIDETPIDISTTTGNVDHEEVDEIVNKYKSYKDYSLIDLGLATGKSIEEKFIIIINYYDAGKHKGSSAIKWDLIYNLPVPEVLPNYTEEPIVEIVNQENIELAALKITTNACKDVKTRIEYCTCELGINNTSYGTLIITDFKEDPEGVWSAKLNQYKDKLPKGEFILIPHIGVFYDGQEPETVKIDVTDGFTLNLIEPLEPSTPSTPDVLWSTNKTDISWKIYIKNRSGEVEEFLHYDPSIDSNPNIFNSFTYDPNSGSLKFSARVDTTLCQPLHLHRLEFTAPPAIDGASMIGAEFIKLFDRTTQVPSIVSLSGSGNKLTYGGATDTDTLLPDLLKANGIINPLDGENITADLSFNIIYEHTASKDTRMLNVNFTINYYDPRDGVSVD